MAVPRNPPSPLPSVNPYAGVTGSCRGGWEKGKGVELGFLGHTDVHLFFPFLKTLWKTRQAEDKLPRRHSRLRRRPEVCVFVRGERGDLICDGRDYLFFTVQYLKRIKNPNS